MGLKVCKKCNKKKLISEFYKCIRAVDKHLGHCKACFIAQRRVWAIKNKSRIKKNRSTTEFKERAHQYYVTYKAKNSDKLKIRSHVSNRIRDGKIKKQPCEVCGTRKLLEAHHKDYSKPFDITWLCNKHHKELHRRIV